VKVLAEEKAAAVSSSSGFNLIKFLGETKAEMGKVSWTTKQELVMDTVVVAVAVVIVCALIWVCDTFFSRLFTLILR
jgi:preprotein translocase subunit SecE